MQIDRKYAKYAVITSIIMVILGIFIFLYLDQLTVGFIMSVAFLYFIAIAFFQWLAPYYDLKKRVYPGNWRLWSFLWLFAGVALIAWSFSNGLRVVLLIAYLATVIGEAWINIHSTRVVTAAKNTQPVKKGPAQTKAYRKHHK